MNVCAHPFRFSRSTLRAFLLLLAGVAFFGAPQDSTGQNMSANPTTLERTADLPEGTAFITVGGGCFWCVEAVFVRIEGILRSTSGFAGGHVANPTYRQVVSGGTGHAEVVQLAYDPAVISLETILEVFWLAHDPTTLNRQGPDVGEHYRSIILYESESEKSLIAESIRRAQGRFANPIVTEVKAFDGFYPAEAYHQDYFDRNPSQPYCRFVIAPKLEKVGAKLKP